MRATVLFLVCVVIAAPMFGQQSLAEAAAQAKAKKQATTNFPANTNATALPPDAPTHDQVMTLLELLRVRNNLIAMMNSLKQAAKEGAEQQFRERIPNPTPAQLEALHGMIDDLLGDMPLDEMIEGMVPVYQRHLTKSDLEELIRFYSSPVGQKLLNEQPQMMQESVQVGVEIQKKRMSTIMARVRERADKLAEETEKTNSSK